MSRLLIVDDDHNTLASLSRAFRLAGHETTVADSAVRALELVRFRPFDLIFSDVVMPEKDGLTLLAEVRAMGVTTPVVMVSGQGTLDMAVRATKLGALDFLEKPLSTERLLLTLENALKISRLETENDDFRSRFARHEIIGQSEEIRRILAQVERVGPSMSRVCLLGETGTGKEVIARAIHETSARKAGRFITLNCAAVPAELIESELFGHEKGAFTGAAVRRLGKFEQAHKGTLFLDEIGDMPASMQAKLLRVLEEGEVERVGGDKPIPVDVRVIVATHRNLEDLVRKNAFRTDLFHRIYVFPMLLPPLRDRKGDVALLVNYFARRVSAENNWKARVFTQEAIALLDRYEWPGNVRELRNAVERMLLLADDAVDEHTVKLALPGLRTSGQGLHAGTLASRVESFERSTIQEELSRHRMNMSAAAKALGLERSHLYKKCAVLAIDLDGLRKGE
ncbi:MAG: sigma-54-dependent Fis family transcriptional regulator [Acidobacteriaceae bacterium]|nr:sigma-54-dependent Fis family transcriptional regulator [Acidobacteriaceae bacterium]MBV9225647.1 sigma-54-dependent Fis family transcriptional regulator [Acidobacteriaceae bacterium]